MEKRCFFLSSLLSFVIARSFVPFLLEYVANKVFFYSFVRIFFSLFRVHKLNRLSAVSSFYDFSLIHPTILLRIQWRQKRDSLVNWFRMCLFVFNLRKWTKSYFVNIIFMAVPVTMWRVLSKDSLQKDRSVSR